MKTVDRNHVFFKRRFSGSSTEDWVGHVNELELQCARKHGWTAKQFFYALRATVTGAAMSTWTALERDEDQPDLGSLLPDWFECESTEYRDLLKQRTSFSRLKERTQVAILYVYFFYRFQRDTPRSAMDDFCFATQESSESVEQWGFRLDRLATKVLSFGLEISFDDYLDQWATGTRDPVFSRKLEEALQSDDPGKPPVVFDYRSFKSWYSRYIGKLVDKRKQLARKSRLMAMNKLRGSLGKSGPGPRKHNNHTPREDRPKGRKPPGVNTNKGSDSRSDSNGRSDPNSGGSRQAHRPKDLSRTGPAPPVNVNKHGNLFRPGMDRNRNRRCFNCDQMGHIAKDCPQPRRARQHRPGWKKRMPALVTELRTLPQDQQTSEAWQQVISSFMAHTDFSKDLNDDNQQHEATDASPHPASGSQLDANNNQVVDKPDIEHHDANDDTDTPQHQEDAELYGYHAYHIGANVGHLRPTTSVSQPHQVTLCMSELLQHQWPEQLSQWSDHCQRALLPWLHKICRRGGEAQCDLQGKTTRLIIFACAWCLAYLGSPLLRSFEELLRLALESGEAAHQTVLGSLEELISVSGDADEITVIQLYSSMVKSLRTMSQEEFGQELFASYHIENETSSDPPEYEWNIPLPGQDFPVAYTPRSQLTGGMGSFDAEGVHEDSREETEAEESGVHDGETAENEKSASFWVVKIKHFPSKGLHRFAIWTTKAWTVRTKGVKLVKVCHELHVARNYIAQSLRGSGPVTDRFPSGVALYDPRGVSASETVLSKLTLYNDPGLEFKTWVETLDEVSSRVQEVTLASPGSSTHGTSDAGFTPERTP